MRKDLKIGMIIGVVLVTAATLAISLWPDVSVESRQKKAFEENKIPLPGPGITSPGIDEIVAGYIKTANVSENIKKPAENAPSVAVDNTPEGLKIHIVAEGETLRDIAEKYYGNRLMINRIVDSNPDVITDINNITAGMKLEIELD